MGSRTARRPQVTQIEWGSHIEEPGEGQECRRSGPTRGRGRGQPTLTGSDQPVLDRVRYRFQAAVDVELAEDVVDMVADRARADKQLLCDRIGRDARCENGQDLTLSTADKGFKLQNSGQ